MDKNPEMNAQSVFGVDIAKEKGKIPGFPEIYKGSIPGLSCFLFLIYFDEACWCWEI